MSRKYMDSPLYVCISGGKDSSVIQQLVIESGLDVVFTHSHTTVDWSDEDVWAFIRSRGVPYNPLYDLGFRRVGCIGSPMASNSERARQFEKVKDFFPA